MTENVGYDVTGYCSYLEDRVEEDTTISLKLGGFIHHLGEADYGGGLTTDDISRCYSIAFLYNQRP